MLVCVREQAEALGAIPTNGTFAVNILGRDREWLSRYFASPRRPRGHAAFDEVSWTPTASGAPVLDGVVGHLDCRVAAVHSAGDHVIVIGAVADLSVREGDPPLLLVHGRYASLAA